MVTDGFLFLGVLMGLAAVIVFLEKRTRLTLFRYVPGFVLMYILTALLNTIGVFDHNEQVLATGTSVQDALLPAMILLLLFQCDVRKIIKLGPKLLLTFVVTAFSIFLGFVVAFLILQKVLDPEAWKALGALSASWTGGSANMVAVQSILQAPQNVFGYVLIVDTIIYSVWLLVMFGSVSISDKFNAWTKADTSYLDAHSGEKEADQQKPIDLGSLMCVIGFGIFISAVATAIGNVLPEVGVVITCLLYTSDAADE